MPFAKNFPIRRATAAVIVIISTAMPMIGFSVLGGCSKESSSADDGPLGVARSALGGTNYCVNHDASAAGCPDGSIVYGKIPDAAASLQSGDILFVIGGGPAYQGDVIFPNSGDASSSEVGDPFARCPLGGVPGRITICGVPGPDGGRPIIQGTDTSVWFGGDHTIFENFEVTSSSASPPATCVYIIADDVTLRNVAVHHCPGHGIFAKDHNWSDGGPGAGSITLDYVEVYSAGSGDQYHPVYIQTDESLRPGSVFRMQHCYLWRGTDYLDGGPGGTSTCDSSDPPVCVFYGGNMLKSRAERNEIYYNRIENAQYLEMELIGPDWGQADGGLYDSGNLYPSDCSALSDYDRLAREDSDVVGNVFVHESDTSVVKLSSDDFGVTAGRYRFVNNTFYVS